MRHLVFDEISVNQQVEENIIMKRIKQFRLKRKQSFCLFIISAFLLVRCAPITSSTLSDTIIGTLTNDQSGLSTQIAQEGESRQSTATNTPQPVATSVLPVLTVSSTPPPTIISPTPAATPTLTSEQLADNFTRLMTENGGCELPCWWGIVPGESNIETIAEQFVPQGLVWWEEWKQLEDSSSRSSAALTFEIDENIIQTINVWGGGEGDGFVQDWGRYSLDQVLTRYGTPSQVFVYYPWRPDPDTPPLYHLLLFYETLGIEIDYVGTSQDINKEETQVCPNLREVFQINLLLYQPARISNIVETVIPPETISFIAGPEIVYDLIEWEQATGTTLDSFYETFKGGNASSCFEFLRY